MILQNALPRLNEAIEQAKQTNKPCEVKFIYNELSTHDTILAVFEWLYKEGVPFQTRYDKYRFIVIIHPKSNLTTT